MARTNMTPTRRAELKARQAVIRAENARRAIMNKIVRCAANAVFIPTEIRFRAAHAAISAR